MYLDVLNTKSKSEINGLVHEKSQMAQMVLQCDQMQSFWDLALILFTKNSPTIVLLYSYFAESLFTSCVIIWVI